jgi:hypothetical protein
MPRRSVRRDGCRRRNDLPLVPQRDRSRLSLPSKMARVKERDAVLVRVRVAAMGGKLFRLVNAQVSFNLADIHSVPPLLNSRSEIR